MLISSDYGNFQTALGSTIEEIAKDISRLGKKTMEQKVDVHEFFHKDSCTCCYVVVDPKTSHCAIIDPCADFNYNAARLTYEFADKLLDFVSQNNLHVDWLLETHAHADHISSAAYLKQKLDNGAQIGISANITVVQKTFSDLLDLKDFPCDGSQFDRLFEDNDEFSIGDLHVRVMQTPGHTPACSSYLVENESVFTGDTLFQPDVGSARCDFPHGSADLMWKSIQKLFSLPDETREFVGHDYPPKDGRGASGQTTIGTQKETNKHFKGGVTREQYIEMRTTRDKQLNVPRLVIPAIQMNIQAGNPPPKTETGKMFLKIPINLF